MAQGEPGFLHHVVLSVVEMGALAVAVLPAWEIITVAAAADTPEEEAVVEMTLLFSWEEEGEALSTEVQAKPIQRDFKQETDRLS